jgi:hypothetical protein
MLSKRGRVISYAPSSIICETKPIEMKEVCVLSTNPFELYISYNTETFVRFSLALVDCNESQYRLVSRRPYAIGSYTDISTTHRKIQRNRRRFSRFLNERQIRHRDIVNSNRLDTVDLRQRQAAINMFTDDQTDLIGRLHKAIQARTTTDSATSRPLDVEETQKVVDISKITEEMILNASTVNYNVYRHPRHHPHHYYIVQVAPFDIKYTSSEKVVVSRGSICKYTIYHDVYRRVEFDLVEVKRLYSMAECDDIRVRLGLLIDSRRSTGRFYENQPRDINVKEQQLKAEKINH